MPIVGLTDRVARFPQIGVLRKGAPKIDEKRPGTDLKNHFRFDTQDQAALEKFARIYGAEPNHIRVMLPYATVEENFSTWQEEWAAGSLKHRCDGMTCVRWLKPDGTYTDQAKPCPGNCKPAGRLLVIIPDMERLAVVMVPTTSKNDIIELQQNLEAAQALRGDLRGVPFILSRRPRKISTPDKDGKRARREKWLLSIEPAPDWVRLQLEQTRLAALPMTGELRALPGPTNGASYVDPDTGELFASDDEEEPEDESGEPCSAEKTAVLERLHELFDHEDRLGLRRHKDRDLDLELYSSGTLIALVAKHNTFVCEAAADIFYAHYSATIGGSDLAAIRKYLGLPTISEPTTIEGWRATAEQVKARKALNDTAKAQQPAPSPYTPTPEQLADWEEARRLVEEKA